MYHVLQRVVINLLLVPASIVLSFASGHIRSRLSVRTLPHGRAVKVIYWMIIIHIRNSCIVNVANILIDHGPFAGIVEREIWDRGLRGDRSRFRSLSCSWFWSGNRSLLLWRRLERRRIYVWNVRVAFFVIIIQFAWSSPSLGLSSILCSGTSRESTFVPFFFWFWLWVCSSLFSSISVRFWGLSKERYTHLSFSLAL